MVKCSQKRSSGRKLINSGIPKRLRDDCLELESYIRSNTMYSIYQLNGEFSKTIVSGETSDISKFMSLNGLNG